MSVLSDAQQSCAKEKKVAAAGIEPGALGGRRRIPRRLGDAAGGRRQGAPGYGRRQQGDLALRPAAHRAPHARRQDGAPPWREGAECRPGGKGLSAALAGRG